MPVFRNINPKRHSGKLRSQTPVINDGDTINYLPNVGPLNGFVSQRPTSTSSLSSSFTAPQFDRSYSHSRKQERRPYIPSDDQQRSSTVNTSCLPSPRESHSRRRESGHIPRPRNAFIIFRSSFISRASAGEGQQNELSKQAGKVWNKMTEEEKRPFVVDANAEKKRHQAMYPNYTYCPGRGAAKRKGKTSTKNTKNSSGPTRRMSATSSSASAAAPESIFSEIFLAVPVQRPPRAAAQRALERFLHPPPSPCPMSPTPSEFLNLELSYPEPDASVEENAYVPATDSGVLKHDIPAEDVLRTAGTPVPELTPIKKEEVGPQFDLTMQPPHLDRIPEQFGFKYQSDSSAMLAYLPPMPNVNDDMVYPGDVPPLFSQISADPPGNSPAVHTTDNSPLVFSSDDMTHDWTQPTTHYSDNPRMHVPGFAWSSYHENFHYAPIYSEETWSEKDMTFMSSVFNFEVLQ